MAQPYEKAKPQQPTEVEQQPGWYIERLVALSLDHPEYLQYVH